MSKKSKTIPVVDNETTCCCSTEKKCEKTCSTEEKCCSSNCNCGAQKSQCKTFIKCFTMFASAAMISASILLVGMECSKQRTIVHTVPAGIKSTQEINSQITKYLRENGPLVAQILEEQKARIEAEKRAEEERARKAAEEERAKKIAVHKDKIIADKTNYSLGNKDGKYVIIEFFDYRCGWCKKTNAALWEQIESKKAPNIRWIPIDSPIFGEGSALISRYVLAAGKQGKYTEMHHEVAKASGNLDKTALVELGKKLKLDIEKLNKDAESEEIKTKIDTNIKLAQELGVSGVPFMIVNGKPHPGALINQALENAVKESNEMK